jgi:hypothetical protein
VELLAVIELRKRVTKLGVARAVSVAVLAERCGWPVYRSLGAGRAEFGDVTTTSGDSADSASPGAVEGAEWLIVLLDAENPLRYFDWVGVPPSVGES